jgi:hypothetical protein
MQLQPSMRRAGTPPAPQREHPVQKRYSPRGLMLAGAALLCGLIGGGAVVANKVAPHLWDGQQSSRSMSIETALLGLLDEQSSDARIASSITVLRAAFSDALPQLTLLRQRGGSLGANAAAVLIELAETSQDETPRIWKEDPLPLEFEEAMLLLEREHGSVPARRLALRQIARVLTDTRIGLERIKTRGGEPGEMAEVHLAWFQTFLDVALRRGPARSGQR